MILARTLILATAFSANHPVCLLSEQPAEAAAEHVTSNMQNNQHRRKTRRSNKKGRKPESKNKKTVKIDHAETSSIHEVMRYIINRGNATALKRPVEPDFQKLTEVMGDRSLLGEDDSKFLTCLNDSEQGKRPRIRVAYSPIKEFPGRIAYIDIPVEAMSEEQLRFARRVKKAIRQVPLAKSILDFILCSDYQLYLVNNATTLRNSWSSTAKKSKKASRAFVAFNYFFLEFNQETSFKELLNTIANEFTHLAVAQVNMRLMPLGANFNMAPILSAQKRATSLLEAAAHDLLVLDLIDLAELAQNLCPDVFKDAYSHSMMCVFGSGVRTDAMKERLRLLRRMAKDYVSPLKPVYPKNADASAARIAFPVEVEDMGRISGVYYRGENGEYWTIPRNDPSIDEKVWGILADVSRILAAVKYSDYYDVKPGPIYIEEIDSALSCFAHTALFPRKCEYRKRYLGRYFCKSFSDEDAVSDSSLKL